MNETKIVRTDTVEGWPLAVVMEGGAEVARMASTELGKKLGFSGKPGDRMRRLASRHREALGRVVTVTTRPEGGGRDFEEEYYTEEQACFLAAKSQTPKATELLKGMIAVFLAWKNGIAKPPQPPQPPQESRLDRIEKMLELLVTVLVKREVSHNPAPNSHPRVLALPPPGESVVQGLVRTTHLRVPGGSAQVEIARKFGLPTSGDGANAVGAIARAVGIAPSIKRIGFDYVITPSNIDESLGYIDWKESSSVGGKPIPHWVYYPKSIETLEPLLTCLKAWFDHFVASGYSKDRSMTDAKAEIRRQHLAMGGSWRDA